MFLKGVLQRLPVQRVNRDPAGRIRGVANASGGRRFPHRDLLRQVMQTDDAVACQQSRPLDDVAKFADVANAALYERLMASTGRSDILAVFRNLRDASQERHLPAFRRCVERRRSSIKGIPS